jgi:hypothetical protein
MSTLLEIEAAAEALPREQKKQLIRFLELRLEPDEKPSPSVKLVRQGDDLLLEARPDAPPMTPENVKRMLADWP